MPGHKNIFRMSGFVEQLHNAARDAKSGVHEKAKAFAEDVKLEPKYVDLSIQFIGASGLPKMDVVGTADPYFVAKLDDKISFVSTVKENTLSPVWNELWNVKNVPTNATLHVQVLDKDKGSPVDDYIGKFETTVSPGAKEVEIHGALLHRNRGTMWLKIESTPSAANAAEHPYTFDGPIRFSRHCSPTVGRLTNVNDARLYSTWKIYLKGVPLFFGDKAQHWNTKYKAAQTIFGSGPASMAVRSGIQAGHRLLYARSTTNGFGVISTPADVLSLLHGGLPGLSPTLQNPAAEAMEARFAHRIKPAVYTYVIAVDDDSFRFSETGAAFFVDFASKHALHANCAPAVRYSGEFHPRPAGGWDAFADETPDHATRWELVIDNNSGTYAPDKTLLPQLKALLEYNFPGFDIYALDRDDPALAESREACRKYALEKRGVAQEELQPHAKEGEVLLSHQAAQLAQAGETELAASVNEGA